MAIPNRKPRNRKVGVRALVHVLDGPEKPYPVWRFSSRVFNEKPNHNRMLRLPTTATRC